MFSDETLLELTRRVKLPDLDFFMNLGDWPLMKFDSRRMGSFEPGKLAPIISWCGSDETMDVVFPTYELMESVWEMLGRQTLDVFSIQGTIDRPWEQKEDIAFFRGRDSSQERLDLVKLSRRFPKLINAGITRFFFFRDVMHEYLPEAEHVAFSKFFNYKYQISMDGTVAAYRMPYLLAGDSLILKQYSPYYEHFYGDLNEFEHFVPVSRNLSDLVDQIRWTKKYEPQVREIIKNAREFVQQNLDPVTLLCYHVKVLEKYSKLFNVVNNVDFSKMDEISQPKQDLSNNCQCERDDSIFSKDEL